MLKYKLKLAGFTIMLIFLFQETVTYSQGNYCTASYQCKTGTIHCTGARECKVGNASVTCDGRTTTCGKER
ncbi:MAG: hypothetical protein QXW79_04355 [Thermoplasmata archaeon]